MSVQALTWVFSQKVGSPVRKNLLFALANFADEHGKCWPSQARLAEIVECSVDTIQRQLAKLEADGFLTRQKRVREDGGRASNVYQLALKKEAASTPRRRMRHTPAAHSAAPPAASGCGAPLPHIDAAGSFNIEPSIEPSSPLSPLRGAERDDQQEVSKGEVWLEADQLRLSPGERTFWLSQFGGDGPRLDLALVTAAAYVQRHSSRPLLVQVRAQLARAASDKRDRDSRYAMAAKANVFCRPPDGEATAKAIFDRVLGRVPS